MPCSNHKNLSTCLARGRVQCFGANRHFYALYLWKTRKDLNACGVDYEGKKDGGVEGDGMCCHMPSFLDPESGIKRWFPKLGEIHFLVGAWDMEVAAHECLHASINFARAVRISPHRTFEDGGLSEHFLTCIPSVAPALSARDLSDEELFCYAHGEMVDAVYRWLWKHDTSKRKRRRT